MTTSNPEISINNSLLEDGQQSKSIKLASEQYEVNVHIALPQIEILKSLNQNSWDETHAIKLGISANSNVFWVYNKSDETLSILIGHDDQTWDISITITWNIFSKITHLL
ncbi:hypothetical protein IT413_04545 [Candidatus Peregrinibacteria bacterium]|nr:hypothetical protein [Candidatus Peregrinibacteria bacterium]